LRDSTAPANARSTMANGDASPLALFPPGAEVVELLLAAEEVFDDEDEPVILRG
jgi:hypothetical protein